MIEIAKEVLYWFINVLILLGGIAYATKLWNDKIRILKGVALFIGGFLWHIIRAIFNYNTDRCELLNEQDSLLIIANKCIPSMSYDIIWAQIAIFIGIFLMVAEFYHRSISNFFAGIDLGTSGCRIIVIDKNLSVKHTQSISYNLEVEQTPQLWWDSVSKLLQDLPPFIKDSLVSLTIDGTSGSILLTDSKGNPTSSALMYNDLRAVKEADIIKKVLPNENGGQGASSSLSRLLWLLKNEASENHSHALHQADYILGKLSNNYRLSDENNCLKLGYDVINRRWPKEELQNMGIDPSLLPEVYPAGTTVATLDKRLAKSFGLSESLQLVTGTTDSIAAFIATGAGKVGDAVTSLGSTLVLKVITDKPIFSPEHGIYSHRLNNHWLVGGASNSGAKVLRYYFSQDQIDEMTPQLSPNNLTDFDYYPLEKAGERFPIADTKKQPQLSPRPESDIDFFQGILEGIAKIEKQAYAKLIELGAPAINSIRSVGGGSKNNAWTVIRKNKLNVDMITPEQTEAAYGSALLAQKGFQED